MLTPHPPTHIVRGEGGSGSMALLRKNLTLDELVTAGFLSQDMIGQNHVCEVKHF